MSQLEDAQKLLSDIRSILGNIKLELEEIRREIMFQNEGMSGEKPSLPKTPSSLSTLEKIRREVLQLTANAEVNETENTVDVVLTSFIDRETYSKLADYVKSLGGRYFPKSEGESAKFIIPKKK